LLVVGPPLLCRSWPVGYPWRILRKSGGWVSRGPLLGSVPRKKAAA
jgi:hypothetical protein